MCTACMSGRCSRHGRRLYEGVPIVESQFVKRGEIIASKRGAFIDAPWLGAVIMHPVTACQLYAAIDMGRPMSDLEVQFEGVRRYLERNIQSSAAAAFRRIRRMYLDEEGEGAG